MFFKNSLLLPQRLIISQIYTGRMPFYEITNDFRMILAVTRGIRPLRVEYTLRKIHGDLDNNVWTLIQACWDHWISNLQSDRMPVKLYSTSLVLLNHRC